MAKPGRKPKPTATKKLIGKPGHRKLPENEPQPRKTNRLPPAPSHLTPVGKNEWERMGTELMRLGLLTVADQTAFAAYCQQYEIWVEASVKVQKEGMLTYAKNGFPMLSPHMTIQNKAQSEMRKWLVEFGMTPSSRSRVEVAPRKEDDPMEAFFKGGGIKAVK